METLSRSSFEGASLGLMLPWEERFLVEGRIGKGING